MSWDDIKYNILNGCIEIFLPNIIRNIFKCFGCDFSE